jgi:hypothetical protein
MMMLSPWTPPVAPVARPRAELGELDRAACACCGVFGFLFSAGTERSTDVAPMRLAV